MTSLPPEDDLAEALADLSSRRTRGEVADVLAYRDRLGASHAEFMALADTDALLDDLIEPPASETLPRDFGPYTLLRELGRGAVGVVYEGVHRSLRRKTAVKVLRRGFDVDPSARERFRNEAASSARVRHDNVVEIYDAGEVEGVPYYAMSLVEGRTLASLIRAREVPAPRELCRQAAAVADALATLHAATIVHRDVKPSNLMVRPDGRMMLADFGLARASDSADLTRTGDALGTPLYMSPEQIRGERHDVDGRSDLYALGATLYEAIAGRPVFAARDFAALAHSVLSERPEPLRRLAPDCPPALERVVMKALEKAPGDRYASAAAMRDDLLAIATGRDRDVVGAPVGRIVHLARATRRRWLPVAAGFALAFGGAWWWTHRAATVELSSVPHGVEVLVAGRVVGTTPTRVSLSPGAYEFTFRTKGFVERARQLRVEAGREIVLEMPLLPEDEHDPVARMRVAKALSPTAVGYAVGTERSVDEPALLWPRGGVRLAELDECAFDLRGDAGLSFTSGAMLEVRRRGETLHRAAFEATGSTGSIPFPPAVREALKVGDVVEWGLYRSDRRRAAGKDLKDLVAEFRVVEADPTAAFAAIDRRFADAPASLAGELRVRALLDLGLDTAALRAVSALADGHLDCLPAQALARQVFRRARLKDSARAHEFAARVAKFPEPDRARLVGAAEDEAAGVR